MLLEMFDGTPVQKRWLSEVEGSAAILVAANNVITVVSMVLKYSLVRTYVRRLDCRKSRCGLGGGLLSSS